MTRLVIRTFPLRPGGAQPRYLGIWLEERCSRGGEVHGVQSSFLFCFSRRDEMKPIHTAWQQLTGLTNVGKKPVSYVRCELVHELDGLLMEDTRNTHPQGPFCSVCRNNYGGYAPCPASSDCMADSCFPAWIYSFHIHLVTKYSGLWTYFNHLYWAAESPSSRLHVQMSVYADEKITWSAGKIIRFFSMTPYQPCKW